MWYLAYFSTWRLKRSSGYRMCARRVAGISSSGRNRPGKIFSYVLTIGSVGSAMYSFTVPSNASIVTFTLLRT